MIVDMLLPKTGMAMQDATIVKWLARVGDSISQGEPLVEIETEKVDAPVEAQATGVLVEICAQAGEVVEVGAVLARIEVAEGARQPRADTLPAAEAAPPSTAAAGPDESDRPALGAVLPLDRMRRTIARRMVDSLSNTAQLTLFTEADAGATVARREAWVAGGARVTYTDILVYYVSRLIERYPVFNGRLEGDQVVISPSVNVGVAVALPQGLIVPVVRDANRKTVFEIADETRRLAEIARQGALTETEVSGGTFTVSNLGTYGVDLFTPILNYPEVAILGAGRIAQKPVVVNGQLQIRPMIGLSLTIDHRVVDGAPGAEFLQALAAALDNGEV